MTKHYVLYILSAIFSMPIYAGVNTDNFLASCSGVTATTPNSKLVSYANCMGRTRGYSDGHAVTVMLHNQIYKADKIKQLWCIPQDHTDGEVIQTVLSWVDRHPIDYANLTTQYSGLSGAYAVTTKALVEYYPCTTPSNKNK